MDVTTIQLQWRLLRAVEQDPTYPSYCSLHFRLFTFTGITTKLPPAI